MTTPGLSQRDRDLAASEHALLYSFSPAEPSGSRFTFASLLDIAGGKYDQQILAQLQPLNGIRTTAYVEFAGEPENPLERRACSKPGEAKVCGPEFVAAWRHVHDLAMQRGLSRLRWVWTLTDKTYLEAPDAVDPY